MYLLQLSRKVNITEGTFNMKCFTYFFMPLFLFPVKAEFHLSEDGGQNIIISDAFIKGRNPTLPY